MSKETRNFDAQVDKILHLMIHSLYTNKDIFLRELISNASDACDKLRYESNKKPDLLDDDSPFKISISVDKEKKLLKIKDNGIGMSKQDLIDNLGTIASSGTKRFLDQLSGDESKDVELIGQFGVGFYAVFMVATEVWVHTMKAGEKTAWTWYSKGDTNFSIEENNDFTERGTEIVIKIKDNEEQYLDRFRISHIVSTYSDHISIPISFYSSEVDKEKILNSSSALWTKQKSDITDEQYEEFYKKIASAGDKPWMTLHNVNEGKVQFTNLLFIPSNPTFDMYHPDRVRRVKLYIKRVFINDEGIDIVPQYMRFLRGVVDSEDLPLNISRENLQHNNIIESIKNSIAKKVVNSLEKKLKSDKEEYIKFWNNFGPVLKEGLCESLNVPENLIDLCIFRHSKSDNYISLAEYVQNMKEQQNEIFYISGGDYEKLKQHPQLEAFEKRDIDVLFLCDTVDDFWVSVVHQYKDKSLKSITRSDIDLGEENKKDDKKEKDKTPEEPKGLVEYCKRVLGNLVSDVKISKKLLSTPACIAVKEGALDIRMERYLIEQKQLKESSAKIFEINAEHPIFQFIASELKAGPGNKTTENLVKILFDQACVVEGEPVQSPKEFSERMSNFLTQVLEKS